MQRENFKKNWKDIVSSFLKLGATAYGGPAIYGILQAELQEKRQWVSKERFVEGVSLANLIPGATMTQLCMFLGHARGGFWAVCLRGFVSCFRLWHHARSHPNLCAPGCDTDHAQRALRPRTGRGGNFRCCRLSPEQV